MHLAIDAVGVRPGSSAIVLRELLEAWSRLEPGDHLTVVSDGAVPFAVPAGAGTRSVGGSGGLGRIAASTIGLRRACGELRADAVLSGNPGTALLGTPCPRAQILHDLRHEQRPHQFSWAKRAARRTTWGLGFRTADVILCVSDRTRADLVGSRPELAARAVTMHLGSDHVDRWPEPDADGYVLAFGHFVNKNADKVVEAWPVFRREHPQLRLRFVGMPAAEREAVQQRLVELGCADSVDLLPWLADGDYPALFAGARLVVFPSDFEGFGLPALEALRLGVRLVVSGDAALREVTNGHAVIADQLSPAGLASAMTAALTTTDAAVEAGRAWAASFRWDDAARIARAALVELIER